jgi:hypothetical protein
MVMERTAECKMEVRWTGEVARCLFLYRSLEVVGASCREIGFVYLPSMELDT